MNQRVLFDVKGPAGNGCEEDIDRREGWGVMTLEYPQIRRIARTEESKTVQGCTRRRASVQQPRSATHSCQRFPHLTESRWPYLGCQALEERHRALVLDQVLHNRDSADLLLEVRVLNPRLHDIQGSCDGDASDCTGNAGNEILAPGSFAVILDTEDVVLGEGGSTEKRKRPGSIARHCPTPSAVERCTLFGKDTEDTTATESLGVHLTLDLEDIEGEENLGDW